MDLHLFAKLQRLWANWDVRCFVLLSLFLQSFLFLIAPIRKRSSCLKIHSMVWLTYLMADWTALFASGLISDINNSRTDCVCSSSNNVHDVMAFWSTFLLVHLGGPDTITAVALEDNELWARHLFKFLGQLISTGLVFYRSFPVNELLWPTILMFIAGIIKYSERIASLHRASFQKINDTLIGEADPGPNYVKLMEEYTRRSEGTKSVQTKSVSEPYKPFTFVSQERSDHKEETVGSREMVRVAYCYYKKFRGLIVDLIFSLKDSQESQQYLLHREPTEAFGVVEIELNFIYEILYTKAVIIHDQALLGYLSRFVYSTLVLLTFGLWYFKNKKSQYFSPYDVKITYTLLFGAIALDLVSYCMLISSDWIIALSKMKEETEDTTISGRCLATIGWAMHKSKCAVHTSQLPKWASGFLSRRWSESIQQRNLIDYCLSGNQWCDKLCHIMGIQDTMDQFKGVTSSKPFSGELRDKIFHELEFKAKQPINKDAKPVYDAKGEWVLEHCFDKDGLKCSDLLSDWVSKIEYDESIIIWHIATDLIYHDDLDSPSAEQHDPDKEAQRQDNYHADESTAPEESKGEWKRKLSKVLSDYMLHLLLREPKIMAEVSSIGRIRFRDTVAEARVFIKNLRLDSGKSPLQRLRRLDQKYERERLQLIIKNLWNVNTMIRPKDAKGDRSKSVLFDACSLARKLRGHISQGVDKWELICSVWVEMLSYAAVHCRGNVHSATLGKGGQLITLVWMLMINLGLGKQFRIKEGNRRVKLEVADN